MNYFRERQPITKDDFLQVLESGNEEAITRAIMDAVDAIDDPAWLLAKLKHVLQTRSELWIRGTTIVALTEVALFNPEIDPNEVYLLIEPYQHKEGFQDWAFSALDDLQNLMHH